MSAYLSGMVVVRRRWQPQRRGRHNAPALGWTLHRASCWVVTRSASPGGALQAPAEPYADTVPCSYCRPLGGGHVFEYESLPDGHVTARCDTCCVKATSRTREGARSAMNRRHGIGVKR